MTDFPFSSLARFFGQQNEVLHHLQAIRGTDLPLATESPAQEIINFLHKGEFSRTAFDDLVQGLGGQDSVTVRAVLVDLVLTYISHAIADHALVEEEKTSLQSIKIMFRLEEGELVAHRPDAVRELLGVQLRRVLEDEHITKDEDLHLVDLQDTFDLGYDQFVALSYPEVLSVRNDLIDVLAKRLNGVPLSEIETLAPDITEFQRLMMLERVFPRPPGLVEDEDSGPSEGTPESDVIAMIWRRQRPL